MPRAKGISIETLRRLKDQGLSYVAIAREVGCDATVVSLRLRGYAPSPNSLQFKAAEERHKNQRASLKHLLDLKRAGYSPRMTELNVPNENLPISMGSQRDVLTLYGSSMQMCQEN
jgi:cyanate lyase